MSNRGAKRTLLPDWTILFGLGGLCALSVILFWPYVAWQNAVSHTPPSAGSQPEQARPSPPTPVVPSALQLAGPHLTWAEHAAEQRLQAQLERIDQFFRQSKNHTPAFARDALSFSSKWRLILDYVPGTRGDRHVEYIRERFNEHIFSPEELETLLKQTIQAYVQQLDSLDNEVLVRVRVDTADFSTTYQLATWDERQLRAEYAAAVEKVIHASQADFANTAAGEVVSLIAGEVLTQVAVRLGISAGILGTGAAASPYTLGIGLVVGVIIDQIVWWVYDWTADPKGELAHELNRKLDEIRLLIIGTEESPALKSRLTKYASQRANLRRAALLSLLQANHPQP
ncbi:MAG: hypothetical protein SFX18_14770 [Pirellulales bacterium]|nr:hypothetical protein [Pirellulales bacterium]